MEQEKIDKPMNHFTDAIPMILGESGKNLPLLPPDQKNIIRWHDLMTKHKAEQAPCYKQRLYDEVALRAAVHFSLSPYADRAIKDAFDFADEFMRIRKERMYKNVEHRTPSPQENHDEDTVPTS